MSIILLLLLLILFVLNYLLNDRCFCAPAVIFNLSYLLSAAFACVFSRAWQLDDMHANTLLVIFGAVLLFSACTQIVKYRSAGRETQGPPEKREIRYSYNAKRLLVALVAFELIVLILYVSTIRSVTQMGALSDSISSLYRSEYDLNLPLPMRLSLSVVRALGFWFSYRLVVSAVYNRKLDIVAFIGFAISAVSTMMTGSRGVAVLMLISLAIYYFLFDYMLNRGNRTASYKAVAVAALLFIVLVGLFPTIGNMLGRTTSMDSMEYISAYVGAEIKNLDVYLNNYSVPTNEGTWGGTSFFSLFSTLKKNFGFPFEQSALHHPYNYVNGIFLGNVYSMVYELLFDFGYVGCFVIVGVLAVLMQKCFDAATGSDCATASTFVVLYGYTASILALSFFSWWYGNMVVSTGFVYLMVTWLALNHVMRSGMPSWPMANRRSSRHRSQGVLE